MVSFDTCDNKTSLDTCDNKTSLDTASPDSTDASSFHTFRDSSELIANILFAYNLRVCLNPSPDVFFVSNPFSLFGIMEQEPCQGQLDPKGNKRKKTKKVSCYRFFDTNPAVQRVTSRVHYVGLRNLGATCYMNCYLQTLFMNSDFRYRIFSLQDASLSEMKETNVLYELKKLFYSLQSGATHVADPSGIARELHISTENQGDATEFATLLLMTLEKHLGGKTSDRNFIPELFRGYQTQRMTCQSCGKVSLKTEDFYELRVQLFTNTTNEPQEKITQQNGKNATVVPSQRCTSDQPLRCLKKSKKTRGLRTTDLSPHAQKIVSLEDALSHALRSETLRDDNRYMCDGCQRKVNAERQVFLTSLPPYLHICFERYAYQADSRQKLTTLVDYPLTLNLTKYCCLVDSDNIVPNKNPTNSSLSENTDPYEYELIAILEHQGSSALTGHYVAYIRDDDTQFQNDKSRGAASLPQESQQVNPESTYLEAENNTRTDLISDEKSDLFCKNRKTKKTKSEQLKETSSKRSKCDEVKKSRKSSMTGHVPGRALSLKRNGPRMKCTQPSTPPRSTPPRSTPPRSTPPPLTPALSTPPQQAEKVYIPHESKTTTVSFQTSSNSCSLTQNDSCDMKKRSSPKRFHLDKRGQSDNAMFSSCKSSKIAFSNDQNPCSSSVNWPRGACPYSPMDPFYQAAACYFLSHYSQRLPFQVQPLSPYPWWQQQTTGPTTTLPMSPYASSSLATLSSYSGMSLPAGPPYTEMSLQPGSLYNRMSVQAGFPYTGMPLQAGSPYTGLLSPSVPPYPMSFVPLSSNDITTPLQTKFPSADQPLHCNVSIRHQTNVSALGKMQMSQTHAKSDSSMSNAALTCIPSSEQGSRLCPERHVSVKTNIGATRLGDSLLSKVVAPTTIINTTQYDAASENTQLEKCQDVLKDSIEPFKLHCHQEHPIHTSPSNSQTADVAESCMLRDYKTQLASDVQTNVIVLKKENNKKKATLCEENQSTQDALDCKTISEYNKGVGTTLVQVGDHREKEAHGQTVCETKTLSKTACNMNCQSRKMFKSEAKCDKSERKGHGVANKDADDPVQEDVEPHRIKDTNVTEKKWSWIQFDDATVSEWKIESHLYDASQKNVTNTTAASLDVSNARLCSQSAYLILYKTKRFIPSSPATQKASINVCSKRLKKHEKPVSNEDMEVVKKSNAYNDIQRRIRVFQERCNALKKEKYSVTNEWPLLECCLNWMVFIPMRWWTHFLSEIQTVECASSLSDHDRPLNGTNVEETGVWDMPQCKEEGHGYLKTQLTCSTVEYDEILCPHSSMVLEPHCALIHRYPETLKEEKEKVYNEKRQCVHFGIDPLAIWNGSAKLISKDLVQHIFQVYQCKANLPFIEFSKVFCLKCANAFSQLVDYWFEQGTLFHAFMNFLRFQDLVETKHGTKEAALQNHETLIEHNSVSFEHDLDVPKEDYVWISKECLTKFESRFPLRNKHRTRVYTLEDATEDVLRELYRLRQLHKNAQENIIRDESNDSTHNATKHFSKETPSFENSVMDERNNLCFGIVCCHGFLVPDKKATGRRALVRKVELERFLSCEQLKADLLVKEFCVALKYVLKSKVFVEPILCVVCLKKQSKMKTCSNTLKIIDTIQQTCHVCEMALESTRQKEFIWKSKRMSEKVSLGPLFFRRYCKLYQLEHIKRHTSYCLYPGKHYLISGQWLSQYMTDYLMAKNEETAIYPGQINGNILMTTCCHQGQERRCLMYDPAAYLKNHNTFSFHPKENPRHPESDLYFLCYEDDFTKLEALYGSCQVPYLQVELQIPLNSNDAPTRVNYSYSVLTCRQCVLSTWFQEGGKGFFQNVPLQLRVQSSRIPLARQLSRRHVFTVSGDMLVNNLLLKVTSALLIPHDFIINQTYQVFLKGPVIPPFYEAVNIEESHDKNFETMPHDILFQKVNAMNSNSSLASGYFSNGTLECCIRLRLNSTKVLKDFHTKIDSRWFIHVVEQTNASL